MQASAAPCTKYWNGNCQPAGPPKNGVEIGCTWKNRYSNLGFGGEQVGVTMWATIDHMPKIQFRGTVRENTHNPKITNTLKFIQPTCWILHLIVVGVVIGPLPRVCCAWPCRCLAVAQQTFRPKRPTLFHTPFFLCVPFLVRATFTVPVVLFVLPSFHKHSPTLGLTPFRLLLPLVTIALSHLYSFFICMLQFALPSSFDALEYRLQGANAKKLDLSTRLDNSNVNMSQ